MIPLAMLSLKLILPFIAVINLLDVNLTVKLDYITIERGITIQLQGILLVMIPLVLLVVMSTCIDTSAMIQLIL